MPVGVQSTDTDFDAPDKTGGSKTVTLTTEQMPSHTHSVKNQNTSTFLVPRGDYYGLITSANSGSSGSAGGDKPHNNMSPFVTAYFWKRSA